MKMKLLLIALILMPIYKLHSTGDHTGHDHIDETETRHHGDLDEKPPHDIKDEHSGHDHDETKKRESLGDNHGHKAHGGIDDLKDHDGHGTMDEHEGHSNHEKHEGHDSHAGYDDHGGHEGHGSSKVIGEGKAILEVDLEHGFKLSKEAYKTLKIKVKKVKASQFTISKESLIASKKLKGVYRFKDGFFKFINIKIVKEKNDQYLVESIKVKSGDKIVISGVGLLRVTDVYSTDESEYGHSH